MIKVLGTVRPKNLVIMAACANVAEEMAITTVITCGINGKHKNNSLHYNGNALDIRSKDIVHKMIFLSRVMKRLGLGYEGFLEAEGTNNEHFHIEYDPK